MKARKVANRKMDDTQQKLDKETPPTEFTMRSSLPGKCLRH